MYRHNQIPRKLLITVDEVVAAGPTDNDVDPRIILSSIQIAEDRFIKPAIGKDLYYDFREQKNKVVTDENKAALELLVGATLKIGDIINALEFVEKPLYKELWNEYLWKITAECVVYIASPTNFSRFTAAGEMENNPKTITNDGQNSATVDLGKMKWKLDKFMMDRIDPLLAAMNEWMHDNNFPLYKKRNSDADGISYKRKTAWIHNIYDKKKKCCNED